MASSVKEYKIDRNILDKVFLDHLFSSLAPSTPYLGDLGYYGEISAVLDCHFCHSMRDFDSI